MQSESARAAGNLESGIASGDKAKPGGPDVTVNAKYRITRKFLRDRISGSQTPLMKNQDVTRR